MHGGHYSTQMIRRLEGYKTYLMGAPPPAPVIAVCASTPDEVAVKQPATIKVFGFGFRPVVGVAANALAGRSFYIIVRHEDGREQRIDDPTTVAVASPFQLTLNLTGKSAEFLTSTARLLLLQYDDGRHKLTLPSEVAVTAGRPRLGVVAVQDTASGNFPHAVALA